MKASIARAEQARKKADAEEAARREAQLPINFKPDFGYWAKLPYWNIEEAVALVLGRDPKYANRKGVQPYLNVSWGARQYEQTLVIAERAVGMQQLTNGTIPGPFLAWAKRYDISVPAELEAAVTKYGGFIGDWKTLYDQALAQRDAALERENKLADMIETAKHQVADLTSQLSTRAALAATGSKPRKEADPREVDTLRKLCIGLAIGGYGYNPADRRSTKVPEIVSDLERLGVMVSDDTVRKHLKAGADMLPSDWAEGSRG